MFAFLQKSQPGSDMTADEAIRKHLDGEIVLIDVRDPSELAWGAAKGALNIPTATLMMRADPRSPECLPELKQGKPVVVFCASGGRSAMAKQMLERMGHAEVHNIGGFGHWQRAGGPCV